MIRPTTMRERRLVAIGLLVAAIALLQIAVIGPVIDGFAARSERRAALTLEYAHNARTIAGIPRLRRQAEAERDRIARFVMQAPDMATASQRLRERVEQVVTAAGGEFQAGEDADAPPGRLALRASARLTPDQLSRALARLQAEPPWLVIRAMEIAADEAPSRPDSKPMDVTLEIIVPIRIAAPR